MKIPNWNSLTNGMKAKGSTGNGALTWQFHKRVYGPGFTYFDFAPMFRAELYNADHWAAGGDSAWASIIRSLNGKTRSGSPTGIATSPNICFRSSKTW